MGKSKQVNPKNKPQKNEGTIAYNELFSFIEQAPSTTIVTGKLIQNSSLPTFVLDRQHKVIIWNMACEKLTGIKAADVIGTDNHWKAFYDRKKPCLADIVIDGNYDQLPGKYDVYIQSELAQGSLHGEGWFPNMGGQDRFLIFDTTVIYNSDNELMAVCETLRDITERKQREDILQRYQHLSEYARDIILFVRQDGSIMEANNAAVKAYGYERQELLKLNIKDLRPDDSKSELAEHMATAATKGLLLECLQLRKDGSTFPVEISAQGTTIGKEYVLLGIIRDVTERKQAEDVAKRYQLLSEGTPDIILFSKPDGQIVEANRAAVRAYGYTREELLGMKTQDIIGYKSKALIKRRLNEADGNGVIFESFHRRKDGSTFPVEVSSQTSDIGNEKVLLNIIRDISERKQVENKINHIAYHDLLTDLPNRLLFYECLARELISADHNRYKLAVLFLDMDNFKQINDTMGHAMGDMVLKIIADRLRSCVRKTDVIARLGGDEFTILISHFDNEENVSKVAQKILATFKQPLMDNCACQVTCSIGIAMYPKDGTDAEALTKYADTAMYWAKEMGNNYQFYHPKMEEAH